MPTQSAQKHAPGGVHVAIKIDSSFLLSEIEDIINTMPPRETNRHNDKPENIAWFGRVSAAIERWNHDKSVLAKEYNDLFFSNIHARESAHGLTKLLGLLNQAKTELQWESGTSENGAAVDKDNDKKIFIGHGRSRIWYELKAFLNVRLHLECDEFNSEPVAGISTTARLQKLVDNARFAFLIMTAEDIHTDETTHARENVIHEAGLFQGRLGFERAIILLEEGCARFSNIDGLTHIGFPKGNLAPAFEQIRRVLEREEINHTNKKREEPAVPSREKPSVEWGCYQFDGEDGLFCTACYDTKGNRIRTTRLDIKFRQCPFCKARFGAG